MANIFENYFNEDKDKDKAEENVFSSYFKEEPKQQPAPQPKEEIKPEPRKSFLQKAKEKVTGVVRDVKDIIKYATPEIIGEEISKITSPPSQRDVFEKTRALYEADTGKQISQEQVKSLSESLFKDSKTDVVTATKEKEKYNEYLANVYADKLTKQEIARKQGDIKTANKYDLEIKEIVSAMDDPILSPASLENKKNVASKYALERGVQSFSAGGSTFLSSMAGASRFVNEYMADKAEELQSDSNSEVTNKVLEAFVQRRKDKAGKAEKLDANVKKWASETMPTNATTAEQFVGALGSTTPYIVTSMITAGVGVPVIAATLLESLSEAGMVYSELREKGQSVSEADDNFGKVFLGNVVFNYVSNLFGIPDTVQKAMSNKVKSQGIKAIIDAIKVPLAEGGQEWVQKIISEFGSDRIKTKEDLLKVATSKEAQTEFGFGALIGAGVKAIEMTIPSFSANYPEITAQAKQKAEGLKQATRDVSIDEKEDYNFSIGGDDYTGKAIKVGGETVGGIEVDYSKQVPEVNGILIEPEYRRQGIGVKVVDSLLQSKDKYYVRATEEAKPFWEEAGVKFDTFNEDAGLYEGFLERKAPKSPAVPEATPEAISNIQKYIQTPAAKLTDETIKSLKESKVGVQDLKFDDKGNITLYRKGEVTEGVPNSFSLTQKEATQKPYTLNKDEILINTNSGQLLDLYSSYFKGAERDANLDALEKFNKLEAEVIAIPEKKVVIAKVPEVTIKKTTPVKPEKKAVTIKPKEVSVPREQLPIKTEGEQKVSRLEARVRNVLKEADQEQIDKLGLTTYTKMNNKEQIDKASEYVKNNPDEALKVLEGSVEAPQGILRNSIFVAMANNSDGQIALQTKLASLSSTRYGQEIEILKELVKDTPIKYISDLIAVREQNVQERYNKPAKDVIKKEVKKIKEKIVKPDKYDWNNFLEEIKC